jgi:RecA-family ATPase
MDLKNIAKALGGDIRSGQVLAPGPGHSRQDRSLSVTPSPATPDGFVVHSFAGDDPIICKDYVREKIGLASFQPSGRQHASDAAVDQALRNALVEVSRPADRIVAAYDYTDESGELLYQVVRLHPKNFRHRRPDGKGGWIWQGSERRVPYRWPEIIKYPDATVFVTEGEKDADRVARLNLCATTVASGEWTADCIKSLTGRDCWILEDNDNAGRKKAQEAAAALYGTAKSVRVVRLPGLADKQDVSDRLDAGHTKQELEDMCCLAPLWEPAKDHKENQKSGHVTDGAVASAFAPLPWLDMSKWNAEPSPERKWAIPDRVPANQAGLFSGEGGTGKSIIELMKNVAHVTGKDWLGSLPAPGPAFYFGAEDDQNELHIRLAAIVSHYGVSFKDLKDLHVLCLLGEDATLCALGKSGKVETTELYKRLYEAAGDIKPTNISIDTLSRAFAGNEIDRAQVYQFASHMQALAMVAGGSVTILSHPSVAGMASGSGISGSTAWHGAFRFRQYLKGAKAEPGEQPDGDLRELHFRKNQYGRLAEAIALRYRHGLFLPESSVSDVEKAARCQLVEDVFVSIGKKLDARGDELSLAQTSHNYAPTIIGKQPEAKGIKKAEMVAAMNALLESGRAKIEILRAGTAREKKVIKF